jgi:hypothetical protein
MDEGILHMELLNWIVTGDSNSEHRWNGGRFHNWVQSVIIVDPRTLSETLEDPTSLLAIKGPIDTKLVCEDPLASDDIGATGPGVKLPVPLLTRAPNLSSIAAHQLGSANATRAEVEIRDNVNGGIDVASTKQFGSTWKPALA